MKPTREQLLALASYNCRVHELIHEGYRKVFSYAVAGLYCSRLVHNNGNRVFVRYSEDDGIMFQTTNGKEVFRDKVL